VRTAVGALLAIAGCVLLTLTSFSGAGLATSEAPSEGGAEPGVNVSHFQRLSYDLRHRPLSEQEKDEIAQTLSFGGMKLYERYVDKWLTKDAYKRFVGAFFRWPPVAVVSPDAETFFHRLSKYRDGTDAIYFLPHAVRGKGGATRSSDETAVMAVEQRSRVITSGMKINRFGGRSLCA
jgi:hypothetical protein